ncbi:hypothetical protein CR513_22088, partial [Mucuna pruriens]
MLIVKSVEKVQAETLEGFTLLHVPREQNERDDLLTKLASTQKGGLNKTVIQEALSRLTIEEVERKKKWSEAIKEVHEGACGSYIGGRALASKIAQAGFYWPTIKRDSLAFVKKCDYFTKWIEVEPIAMISAERVKQFYWKRIICHFGLPTVIQRANEGTMGKRASIGTLVLSHHTTLEYPRNPILPYLWNRYNDPSGGGKVIAMCQVCPTG